jgi:hypothetical protein
MCARRRAPPFVGPRRKFPVVGNCRTDNREIVTFVPQFANISGKVTVTRTRLAHDYGTYRNKENIISLFFFS